MGKRRLKYYRVSTHENEHPSDANRTKSFGRCQLIQSYILEKTGRNRTRKQVSSHLQRLKKIHKNNPASLSRIVILLPAFLMSFPVRPLFSEHSHPLADHCSVQQPVPAPIPSQDTPANLAFGTRHFKSQFDLTSSAQNADTGADNSSTFPYVSEVSSLDGGSCDALDFSTNLHNKSSITHSQELLSPQQSPSNTFHHSDSDFLSELQDPLLFKDALTGAFRADSTYNTSAFSISMRRLASRLPIQGRVDPYPTTHLSRPIHTSASQPAHQWTSYDGWMDSIPCAPPLTAPARQWLHTPFHSPHLLPAEKQRLDPVVASDWAWPQNSDIVLGPQDSNFAEIPPRYPLTVYQPDYTYSEMGINSPVFQSPQSESEGSQFSQGLSYHYMATSPTIVSDVSAESAIDVTGQVSPEIFASLLPVIRPTPIYPVSYIHSDGDPDAPTLNLLLP